MKHVKRSVLNRAVRDGFLEVVFEETSGRWVGVRNTKTGTQFVFCVEEDVTRVRLHFTSNGAKNLFKDVFPCGGTEVREESPASFVFVGRMKDAVLAMEHHFVFQSEFV